MHIMLGQFTLIHSMSSLLYSKHFIQRHSAQHHLTQRNQDIDLLRSLAILYLIILSILSEYVAAIANARILWQDFLFYISLGIICFSSGYLLGDRYYFSNVRQIFAFYYRRFTRLYPFYWITLTILLILDIIPSQIYLNNLTTTHSIYDEPLEILWLVSLILNLYLLFPLFTYHYNFGKIWIILSAFYTISWSILDDLNLDFNNKINLFLPVFVLGIVVARHQFLRTLIHHGFASVISMLVLVALGYFYDEVMMDDSILENFIPGMIAILGIPIFYRISRILRASYQKIQKIICHPQLITKILNFIGYSSFSAYLLHRIIFNTGLELYRPDHGIKTLLYLGAALLPITFLLAYGYQRSINYIISKL